MAAGRLKESDYSQFTQGIIEDLVVSLEELLSALERAEREQQDRQQQGQARGRPAKPGEQPLVDNIAELKMLRILQTRVNGKTSRFSALLNKGSEQASEAELIAALGRLAQRQERVERAAHDIATGRTE
jgi:ATP-dependent exoDNAse (exonuclease V) alpha subunit